MAYKDAEGLIELLVKGKLSNERPENQRKLKEIGQKIDRKIMLSSKERKKGETKENAHKPQKQKWRKGSFLAGEVLLIQPRCFTRKVRSESAEQCAVQKHARENSKLRKLFR